jgi:hypothetical protein
VTGSWQGVLFTGKCRLLVDAVSVGLDLAASAWWSRPWWSRPCGLGLRGGLDLCGLGPGGLDLAVSASVVSTCAVSASAASVVSTCAVSASAASVSASAVSTSASVSYSALLALFSCFFFFTSINIFLVFNRL